MEISSEELLNLLGDEFKKRIEEIPDEKYEEYYRKIKDVEMKRTLMIFKAIKEEEK
ncbi:hypothetical protein NF865_01990 [Thermococcus aggregans]|uniref:Uncharacterized protein n=1 Tax=Thermococcus aggregans TaxID=110163 RepID=A0A9E7MY26_THEAG|nr:hypothetical protein [Thermococcus aggregans]USS41013.1 hypothetical protein NF865_01990 [Thermococcus aggregans]